jgi:hypothetical protein
MKKNSLFLLLICFIMFMLSSCKQDGIVGLNTENTGSGHTDIGSGNTSFSAIAEILPGGNTLRPLIIDSAKFLIEFVKIRNVSGGEHMLRESQLLMRLGMGRTPTQVIIHMVPPGAYNWFQFKLHKHTPGEPVIDPDFGDEHEVGFSSVICGVYNHVPFVYKTNITDVEHMDINPPLVVMPNLFNLNFTMNVISTSWFLRNGIWMDPNDPGNRHDIDQGIKDSFRSAYRDNNRDGLPDNFPAGNAFEY